ncbi:MAG: acylphosphatase [Candidatus Alcyoniella australis]|nr:acylphosphatase [Candidatus Alcyoniella australis]
MSGVHTSQTKALFVCVRGLVQGVWFRASTVERAESLGVCGWVRNAADGSVELHAEGAADAVDELIDWCRQGPSPARVDSLEVAPTQPAGYSRFGVK